MPHHAFVVFCRRLVESPALQRAVLAVILLNAALVGLETDRDLVARHRALFAAVNALVLAVFVAELGLRLAAHGRRPLAFFRDGWNVFDFVIVALSLLPGVGAFATIGRIARVLRVTRLVSAAPRLRLIIGTMMRSIPSLAHVSLLLGLLLYVYAVIGVNLFGAAQPQSWGSLAQALLTLFQMLTLEGWVELQQAAMETKPWAWIYFGSFVIVAVFVVVNLFIAVVLNNLEEIREEDRQAALDARAAAERTRTGDDGSFDRHLAAIRSELERLEALHRRATPANGDRPQAQATHVPRRREG